MVTRGRECFLCGDPIKRQLGFNPSAYTKENQKLLHSLRKSWISCLCTLLDVTAAASQKVLETEPYCLSCHELVSSVEFMMNAVSRMEKKLSEVKQSLKATMVQRSTKSKMSRRRRKLVEILGIDMRLHHNPTEDVVEIKHDPKISNSTTTSCHPAIECEDEVDYGELIPNTRCSDLHIHTDSNSGGNMSLVSADLDEDDPLWMPDEKMNLLEIQFPCVKQTPKHAELKPVASSSKLKSNYKQLLTCDVCQTVVVGKAKLRCHKKDAHPQNVSVSTSCEVCGKVMFGKRELTQHMRRVHNYSSSERGSPMHKCKICSKRLSTVEAVTEHEVLHERSTENPFFCVLCPAQFITMYDLQNHVLTEHEDERTFKCDQCSLVTTSMLRLKSHQKLQHRVGVAKLHHCPHCSFEAVYPSILRNHIKVHGEKLFKCDVDGCEKSFFRINTMNSHKGKVHGLSNKPLHACLLCPRKYFTASLLKQHQIHHSNLRPFMCELCSATFKTDHNLATHRKVHKKASGTNVKLQKPRKARLQCNRQIENLFPNHDELGYRHRTFASS